jgi:hypothetical protein
MAVYTVHVTSDLPADRERAVFVREGFSWGAFWFGPLWLLARGLWLALLGWLLAALLYAFARPHLGGGEGILLGLAIAVFIGLEGNRWRRAKLLRRGYGLRDVVAGRTRDEAESVFFAQFDAAPSRPSGPVPPAATPLPSHAPPVLHEPGVLGLFPEPERSR